MIHLNESEKSHSDQGRKTVSRSVHTFFYGRLTENFSKRECDFVVVDRGQVKTAIQVCFHLMHENHQREIEGLAEVMGRFPDCTGILLTERQEEMLSVEDRPVRVMPVWRWVLEETGFFESQADQ
jgi:hypothetical protein